MIYTVTLNPSIDYIVHVRNLTLGELNRMGENLKLPGGKGINVSRILQRIGIPSIPLGFLGGFTGQFIEDWLTREKIKTSFTKINDDTRINIKLKGDTETEINGPGPTITEEEAQQFTDNLLSSITEKDIIILSGSTPPSLPKGFYHRLVEHIAEKGARFIIDTTGNDLRNALDYHPLLIKPNDDELAELFQKEFTKIDDLMFYGKKLLEAGAQHVIVSLGGKGAIFFTGDKIYQAKPLSGKLKNSVGAGDSMIAGFIGAYEKTQDSLEAFRWGVACGSATAFSNDLATDKLIYSLLPEVTITQL